MAVSTTRRKIDDVLATARKDLQAQREVVRAEIARLAADEQELTAALTTLSSEGPPSPRTGASSRRPPRAKAAKKTRSANGARPRRRRGASRPTTDRVEELRVLLVAGPKSRSELAAALSLSPARVQQLLGGLGDSVTSRANPEGRGKLWSLDTGNGGSAP